MTLIKTRGFEAINKIQKELDEITNFPFGPLTWEQTQLKERLETFELPTRSTKDSAGYDFKAIEYTTVPSIWKQATKFMFNKLFSGGKEVTDELFKPTLVATGVKAYMQEGEVLELYSRSSSPLKLFLILANSVGIIDKDYYDKDGHIMFQFINFGITDQVIKPGDKIGQGIFKQFLVVDGDNATGERNGGFGSTGN